MPRSVQAHVWRRAIVARRGRSLKAKEPLQRSKIENRCRHAAILVRQATDPKT